MRLLLVPLLLPASVLSAQAFRFEASSTRIEAGESARLDWSIPGQGPLRLEPGGLRVPREGRILVKPLTTTTYLLKEEGEEGVIAARVLIMVAAPPIMAPEVCYFEPSATAVLPGEPVVLKWQCNGNARVRLEPGGLELDGQSEVTVTPLESTRYTLSVSNQLGGASKSVDVKVLRTPVKGAPAATCAFDADKKFSYPGDPVELRWDCAGDAKVRLYPGGLELDGKGRVTVTPTATTVYTLSASNAAGGSSRSLEIMVVPRPKPDRPGLDRAKAGGGDAAPPIPSNLEEALRMGQSRREGADKGAWTLRLVVSGRAEGVKDLSKYRGASVEALMVLPYVRRDGFRWWQACWGAFPTRAAALKAFAKLPEPLRRAYPQPLALRLDKLPGDPPKG